MPVFILKALYKSIHAGNGLLIAISDCGRKAYKSISYIKLKKVIPVQPSKSHVQHYFFETVMDTLLFCIGIEAQGQNHH